jgi:hypothetical protein
VLHSSSCTISIASVSENSPPVADTSTVTRGFDWNPRQPLGIVSAIGNRITAIGSRAGSDPARLTGVAGEQRLRLQQHDIYL